MSDGGTATTVGQDEDLGFRPAIARPATPTSGSDDGVGFRPAQSATNDDGLGFRPAPSTAARPAPKTASQWELPPGLSQSTIDYEVKYNDAKPPSTSQPQTPSPRWADFAKPGPYVTELSPADERQFQGWVKTNQIPFENDSPTSDYDMRGFWKAQRAGDPLAVRSAQNGHFPDKWKTPYHETFSNESLYALPTAGHWEGNTFVPPTPQAQLPQRSGATISAAAPPTFMQRARSTIANSAIGHALEEATPRLADTLGLRPTETVYNPELSAHARELIAPGAAIDKPGVTKGVAEFTGALTTPENVLLTAGSGGLGLLRPVLGEAGVQAASRLVGAGFSAQMLSQAVKEYPQLRDALKAGRYDEARQILTDMGLSAGMAALGVRHAGTESAPTPQERYGATLEPSEAAPREAIVDGDTAPDYLARVRQRVADQVTATEQQDRAEAQRQARINAPVNLPRLPETTEQPPILTPAPQRTPMQELSAQADEVRGARQFREQLTNELAGEMISRLRDEGLLEPVQPDVRVIDRRAVRPEDVEPVQPQRTFIGSENVPPAGMERVRASEIRNDLARISRGEIGGRVADPKTIYAPDVLDEARAMMAHTHDFLSQQERPGRYFADMGDETSLTGRGPTLPITAIKSWRGQFPWFADLKESPGELAKALRLGEGPGYDRLITAAAEHIVRTRAETQSMARSVEPNIENLAEQVRAIDPELANFLASAARGDLSTWVETSQERLRTIEGRISDAKAALEFGRAIDDLASEERAGNGPAAQAGEAEASAARSEAGARTGEGEAAESGEDLSSQPSRRNEGGFITPQFARDLVTGQLTKEAYQRYIAGPLIEKGLGLGDKYAAVQKADPSIAAGLHLLDNAPAYLRAKAARNVHDVIGSLSRAQERLFTLMADAASRENLRTNHPDEYRRAAADPAIQEALRKYRPIERDLTAARQRIGGETLDQDYLRRVYDQHVAGIGRAEAPGSAERATTAFDRVIQPQRLRNMSRESTAEYHYQHGLHEFGPAFGTKFIATNLRALENQVATDFISKATEIRPGDAQPRAITYEGEKYYRPDIARAMREAGQKNVRTFDMYDPTSGVKYPQRGQSQYLGPSEVVRALNDHGSDRANEPGAVRRFLQEQTISFGFGIPHVANILRRVTQSAPLGAANPEAWVLRGKSHSGRNSGTAASAESTTQRLIGSCSKAPSPPAKWRTSKPTGAATSTPRTGRVSSRESVIR